MHESFPQHEIEAIRSQEAAAKEAPFAPCCLMIHPLSIALWEWCTHIHRLASASDWSSISRRCSFVRAFSIGAGCA